MINYFIALTTLLAVNSLAWTQVEHWEALKYIDTQFSTFLMEFTYLEPGLSFDPDQGIKISQSKITVSPEAMALEMINSFDKDPVYKNMGTLDYHNYDYNPDGDLIIWRTLSKYAVSDKEGNLSIQQLQSCNINELRKVSKLEPRYRRTEFSIGSSDNVYEYVHILMGSGRNFTSYLEEVESIEELSDGNLEIEGTGNYGPGNNGRWKLVVDIENEYLVRKAEYFPKGGTETYLSIETEGIIKGNGLSVAAKGTLKFSFPNGYLFEIVVQPSSVDSRFDQTFLKETKEIVHKDDIKMELVDLRRQKQ